MSPTGRIMSIFASMKRILALPLIIALIVSCSTNSKQYDWSDASSWYRSQIDTTKPDIFYLVSTNVLSNADGSYYSTLCQADKEAMTREMDYIDSTISQGSFNLIAPYYHQLTLNSFSLPKDQFDEAFQSVNEEVIAAFDWYMANLNGGRPFVLAGFSQGAMLEVDIMSHMSDEQYGRMAAAYMMGSCITCEDILNDHIVAATGEEDTGVTVSFNSVLSPGAAWPAIAKDAAACINPLNWKTDSTPATFSFYGNEASVSVDTANNLLVFDTDPAPYHDWMEKHTYFTDLGLSKDCLHHWDIKFFNQAIHDNALKRINSLKVNGK